MKKVSYLLSLFVLASVLAMVGCGDDGGDGPSLEDQQLARLVGQWNLVSANDGSPRSDYDGFTLTIQESRAYITSGGPDLLPFPPNGSFQFGTPVESQLIVADAGGDITMAYSVTDNSLQLSFTYNGAGFPNSRTASVEGDWVFNFEK